MISQKTSSGSKLWQAIDAGKICAGCNAPLWKRNAEIKNKNKEGNKIGNAGSWRKLLGVQCLVIWPYWECSVCEHVVGMPLKDVCYGWGILRWRRSLFSAHNTGFLMFEVVGCLLQPWKTLEVCVSKGKVCLKGTHARTQGQQKCLRLVGFLSVSCFFCLSCICSPLWPFHLPRPDLYRRESQKIWAWPKSSSFSHREFAENPNKLWPTQQNRGGFWGLMSFITNGNQGTHTPYLDP